MDEFGPEQKPRTPSREELERLCLHNLLASHNERIFFKDTDGRLLLVSEGFLAHLAGGSGLAEVIGKTDFDVFSQPHAAAALEDEQHLMATGEPLVEKVERETFNDRDDIWVSTTKLPLRNEAGRIVGVWGISRDITAQVSAEQLIEANRQLAAVNERQHRLLFELNPQPVFVYDRHTLEIVAVSNATVTTYGYTREELLSMSVIDVRPVEDRASFLEYLRSGRRSIGSEVSVPWRHQYKDGTIIEVAITSDEVVFDGHECRIALCHNVTERNRAATELAAARDEAVEASNLKSAFLANMSHEIRTPMNGVIGMTELLLDTELSREQRSYAAQVARSGEQMLTLINDILDVSKIEAGQLELDIADFDLHDTVEQTCELAGLKAHAIGIKLNVAIEPGTPRHVRGDAGRLRQVLLNLVANAVKFTAAGGVSIRVGAQERDGDSDGRTLVRIAVSDTGIGIDPQILSQMFEPFTQADPSTTRNYGGTGLGLAIVRELVELMGGTIGCRSEPGVGSTFFFTVPLAPTSAAGSPPGRTEPDAIRESASWAGVPALLVVEDSPVNQVVAVRTLERLGCECDVATDGREALEALSRRRYDAVMMDCQMPVMDGYEATAELRRREADGRRRTPVIAMTAHAMKGDAERCLAAGMDDYIAKPMRRELLLEALRRWLPQEGQDASGGNGANGTGQSAHAGETAAAVPASD
ncbi:MAG TPA: ATP-binding protein [Solirubrobacteraceae bacterium]|nr:ATP-binding protein [Solirubrobacteraceae bacterium]